MKRSDKKLSGTVNGGIKKLRIANKARLVVVVDGALDGVPELVDEGRVELWRVHRSNQRPAGRSALLFNTGGTRRC